MSERLRRCIPVAVSFLGHLALAALVAGVGLLAGPAPGSGPSAIPVRRAPDVAATPGPRLLLEAPEEAAATPAAPEDAAVALETADPRYRPYLAGVKRRIWERWETPALPDDRLARGILVVEFTLTRSGRVATAGVSEASGVPALDRAALSAVASAGPFPPLPATIAGNSLRVRARFIYD